MGRKHQLEPSGFRGYMTVREYLTLQATVSAIPRELHGREVVEIGCGIGSSTARIAAALEEAGNPATLLAIDPLAYPADVVQKMTHGEYDDQKKAILRSVRAHRGRVRLVTRHSAEAFEGWDREIALLLIDGDHREEAVTLDLRFAAHVAVGGYLVMHDVGSHPGSRMGPTRAFIRWWSENWARWVQVVHVGTLLVVQRRC